MRLTLLLALVLVLVLALTETALRTLLMQGRAPVQQSVAGALPMALRRAMKPHSLRRLFPATLAQCAEHSPALAPWLQQQKWLHRCWTLTS